VQDELKPSLHQLKTCSFDITIDLPVHVFVNRDNLGWRGIGSVSYNTTTAILDHPIDERLYIHTYPTEYQQDGINNGSIGNIRK
jgi:hypothetical protein